MQRQFWVRRPLVMLLLSLLVAVAIGCGERGSGWKLHESNLQLAVVLKEPT